jgi:hypothetical protein
MMMVAAGGEKRGLVSKSLCHLEAEHVAIETERAFEIGDLQVNVPDPDARVDRGDGWVGGHG